MITIQIGDSVYKVDIPENEWVNLADLIADAEEISPDEAGWHTADTVIWNEDAIEIWQWIIEND